LARDRLVADETARDATKSAPTKGRARGARRPIGKRLRFEIYKRDRFRCVYCGRTPTEAVLEVDHLVPVAGGGTDDPENLFTACRDCNAGKSDRPLTSALPQVRRDEIQELAERVEQMRAYQAWRAEFENALGAEIDAVYDAWVGEFGGGVVETDGGQEYRSDVAFPTAKSIRGFLDALPTAEIIDAVRVAGWRYQKRDGDTLRRGDVARYFYGVCRNKIRLRDEARRHLHVTWDDLAEALPEIVALRDEVAGFAPADPWHFCGEDLWKNGWTVSFGDSTVHDAEAPTARIARLVGHRGANARDPILGTQAAYDVAVRTIRSVIPPCGQACACGRPKRAPRPEDYPRCRWCDQVTEPVDRRESCVETRVTWEGRECRAVPYGNEAWLNAVTIARKWARWERLHDPYTPITPPRCTGCRAPVGGFHHPGCAEEACPVCGQKGGACGSAHHRAKVFEVTVGQAAARLRQWNERHPV
jgi:HNH endonuclease